MILTERQKKKRGYAALSSDYCLIKTEINPCCSGKVLCQH